MTEEGEAEGWVEAGDGIEEELSLVAASMSKGVNSAVDIVLTGAGAIIDGEAVTSDGRDKEAGVTSRSWILSSLFSLSRLSTYSDAWAWDMRRAWYFASSFGCSIEASYPTLFTDEEVDSCCCCCCC